MACSSTLACVYKYKYKPWGAISWLYMVAIINDEDVEKWREAAQDMHEEIVKWMNLSIHYENVIRELKLKLESTSEENNCRLINENGSSNSNKKMGKDYDECDAWEVFRFQLNFEQSENTGAFNTVNDFLEYWLKVYNNRQDSSRLEPVYIKKKDIGKSSISSDYKIQEDASERYSLLSYSDKAIYRAIGKEYFRKRKKYLPEPRR